MATYALTPTDEAATATLRVGKPAPNETPLSRRLNGKFCEHLGSNIYRGMHAQVLQSPTFGDWPFADGMRPDGGIKRTADEERIAETIRRGAEREGWPEPELLVESRRDCLAHWWIREGERESVRFTSDVNELGKRAQRVEAFADGAGIAQYCYLPLHRVRSYEWTVVVRSPHPLDLTVALFGPDKPATALCTGVLKAVAAQWQAFTGTFEVPETAPDEGIYRLALSADAQGQFVVNRVLLSPTDNVSGCDLDVVRLLRDSSLALLRWPGGNFVSGYHWRDGVGPIEQRPTRDNPAWACLEYNLFGTDEFMAFCRLVGCEPQICVNAGDGTSQEAADWVEYCNGSADTPMGRLRAANGHPEPYGVKLWEVGNEVYGSWQTGWTTSAGYADRYGRFSKAMLERDPSITLIANGAPTFFAGPTGGGPDVWTESPRLDWNRRLCREYADSLQWISDHVLEGVAFPASTNPVHVFSEYMMVPDVFERSWSMARDIMRESGVRDPRLALTELQIFGSPKQPEKGEEATLTRMTMATPDTQAEAVHYTMFFHVAARLHPFLGLITHSATVNHGGGVRKTRERVYPNPVLYARGMHAAFGGGLPCPVELTCAAEHSPGAWPGRSTKETMSAVSVAAVEKDGTVLLSLANRSIQGPVTVRVQLWDDSVAGKADVQTLSSEHPWDRNSVETPDAIRPQSSSVNVSGGAFELTVPLFGVTVVRLPKSRRS